MNTMPIFVKIDEYKEVLEVLNLLNRKLEKARELIEKINEIKNQEDVELDQWEKDLSEVEKKLEFMTKTLIEPNM